MSRISRFPLCPHYELSIDHPLFPLLNFKEQGAGQFAIALARADARQLFHIIMY